MVYKDPKSMLNAIKSVLRTLLLVCSFLLVVLGVVMFFAGDMALHEFGHFHYLSSELLGLLAGLTLIGLGLMLGIVTLETIKGRRSST